MVYVKPWAVLGLLYLVIRFGFTRQLDALGTYASYIFEAILIGITVAFANKKLLKQSGIPKLAIASALGGLIFGFSIYRSAILAGITIPFDLKGTETLVFLLAVAPVLEELIFRFFLWQPIEELTKKPLIAWVVTSVIFSYSHLHAMWFVPDSIHQFISYQTIYTLGLGLACGYIVRKHNSLFGAIAIHFTFNLGFYLASL